MAKFKVTTDKGTFIVTTEDAAAPTPAAASAAPSPTGGNPMPSPGQTPQPPQPGFLDRAKDAATSFLRTPALPIIAGTGAGLATGAMSPLVSAPSAALAGAAGEAYRQLGLRALGDDSAPATSGDAASLIAKRGTEQGIAELGGRAIGAIAKPVIGLAAKGGAAAMKGLTKIPAENFLRIFKNPAELFTAPGKKVIEAAYGKVGFLGEETVAEAAKGATTSNAAFIRSGMKELDKPFSRIDPAKLLDARKAVDAEIDQLRFAGGPKQARSVVKSKLARLQQVRDGLNQGLDILGGKSEIKPFNGINADAAALRDADALNAAGAAANSFRSLIPRVNVMQSVPRFLTLPFVVPAVAGGATAAAGAAVKAAGPVGRMALGAGMTGADMGSILADALQRNRKKK